MARGENHQSDLRKRAEDALSGMPPDLNGLSLEDIQTLIHELQVHQIELELQNEELRKTQYALAEAQSRYIDLYDFAPVGYFTLNQAGVIEDVNLAGAALVNIERSRLIQRSFSRMVYSEDQDPYYLYLKKLFKTLSSHSLDIRLVKPDGMPFDVHLTGAVVYGDETHFSQCRMIVSNITEQKRAEQQALELAANKENIRTLSNFIRSASHEFRTPLSNVLLDLYLLKKCVDPVQASDCIDKIKQQVKYITKLVDALATIARLDSNLAFEFETIQLNSFMEEVSPLMTQEAQGKNIRVEFEMDSNLPSIEADTGELHVALWNIFDNAVRYTGPGGIITIYVSHKAKSVLIEVHDTGIGISEADMPLIFERFYRVDLVHSVRGLGLGLSIANQIIQRHGGKIEVESRLGQGSMFRVILPIDHRVDLL
jgi:PAS domain S-box-containing protein